MSLLEDSRDRALALGLKAAAEALDRKIGRIECLKSGRDAHVRLVELFSGTNEVPRKGVLSCLRLIEDGENALEAMLATSETDRARLVARVRELEHLLATTATGNVKVRP